MFTDDISGEMKEQTDATDTGNASNNSERRDVHEQPDERPSSIILQQSAIHRGRRSSLTSCGGSSSGINTPDPDIENSLAYTSAKSREGSVKRTKKSLPPGEPNEVTERVTINVDLPGLFRNKLITAAINHADEERKLLRNHTPDSMKMDDSNSTVSSMHSTSTMPDMESFEQENTEEKTTMPDLESLEQENIEEKTTLPDVESFGQENTDERTPSIDINSRPSTLGKEQSLVLEDKTVKSESYLLNLQQVDSYVQRAQSAPVEVASICTQTEWSWIEDMKKYEQMKSEMQTSQNFVEETVAKVEKEEDIERSSNLPIPETKIEENQTENSIKDEELDDELFRPATVEYSSSSSDEDDGVQIFDRESFLPSIGPPKILQYVKESVNPPFTNECPVEDVVTRSASSREGHSCAYCKVEALEKSLTAEHVSLADTAKSECPVYHEHLKQQFVHKEDDDFVKDEIIDIRPHPPFGTKAARKEAKERAAARAREREAERQKVSGTSVNYYAMTRQMKTLTYSLASTKCMDDGWTVRPLSPIGTESSDHLEPFEIEINSSRAQRRETFMERFYQNGNRLLVLFPDGTGCCYYPSGNPAVIISSTEKGKYSYILQEDTYEHSRENTGVLGVFDPTGHGSCYYQQNGKLRLVLTPFGGTFFDIKGEKKKKWFWYNITGSYVHAPPFQPITFAWTKELSLRCMGQDYIIITYNHGRHTIRFNVGARLKPVVKKVKLPTDQEYYDMQLKEIRKFVNLLIERVQTTLRFPHSHRIHKLQIPERRSSKPARIESRVIDDNTKDDKTTVVVN